MKARFSLTTKVIALTCLGLFLSSCASENSANPKQLASPTETNLTRPASEYQIPEDFPSDIPIHAGEIVLGSVAGEGSAKTWAVEVLIDDLEQGREDSLRELKAAGFELVEESGFGTEEYLATLKRHDYLVMLKVYFETQTNELEIRYVVTGA